MSFTEAVRRQSDSVVNTQRFKTKKEPVFSSLTPRKSIGNISFSKSHHEVSSSSLVSRFEGSLARSDHKLKHFTLKTISRVRRSATTVNIQEERSKPVRPRRKNIGVEPDIYELCFAFSTMLFEDTEAYIIRYMFNQMEKRTMIKCLRAVLDLSVMENCSILLLKNILHSDISANGCLSMSPLPTICLAGKYKAQNTFQDFKPWMITQSLVSMKSTVLIKKIDATLQSILTQVRRAILDDTETKIPSESQLNPENQFYKMLTASHENIEPLVIFPNIIAATKEILITIKELCESDVAYDMLGMINSFYDVTGEFDIDILDKEKYLFWCFFYPLLNLTPIAIRRRTKVTVDNYQTLLQCFLLLKQVILGDTILLSTSTQDSFSLKIIQQTYNEILASFSIPHEKDLGDTVMEVCGVGDENKAILPLCEQFCEHHEPILEYLLKDPIANEDVLMQFVAFIRHGVRELE